MLDRKVVKEFLNGELRETEVPIEISKGELIETFCKYVEEDYYQWLKDNFKSFFNYGNPDWDWIKKKVRVFSKD
jgi:hypothetical protein